MEIDVNMISGIGMRNDSYFENTENRNRIKK